MHDVVFVYCRLDVVKATREYSIGGKVHSMRVCFVRPPEFSRHVIIFPAMSTFAL